MTKSRRDNKICLIVDDQPLASLDLTFEFARSGFKIAGPFVTCTEADKNLQHRSVSIAIIDKTDRDGSFERLYDPLRAKENPRNHSFRIRPG